MNNTNDKSKPAKYTGKVTKKEFLNPKVTFVRIEHQSPENLEFLSGQYCSIEVAEGIHRAYSIGSSGKEHSFIDLYIDITPDGPGSHYFENLHEGDEVHYIAPQGRFVYEEGDNKMCFISTGTGIVPFLSMLDHAIDDGFDEEITLLQGHSFLNDIFIKEKLDEYVEKHGKFNYKLCITREESDFTAQCRVTDFLVKHFEAEKFENTIFYVCGFKGMVMDVEKILLDKGVTKDNIKYEKY